MRGGRAIFLIYLAGVALAAENPAPGPVSREKARRLFRRKCRTCHDPGRVAHRTAGRDEWREIVDRMRRMPQSGISNKDAAIILDYLVSLHVAPRERDARQAVVTDALGGRSAYGREWLSILEIATVSRSKVAIGGVAYAAKAEGRAVRLSRAGWSGFVSLDAKGAPDRTARIDAWKIGKARYELHLVLYEIRAGRFRVGLGLRKTTRKATD